MNAHRRHLLLALCALPSLAIVGCAKESVAAAAPVDFDTASTCDLDGMLLADYAGPKAQIHYAGNAAPVFFCDTVEMFAALLKPEQARAVRAAFVQDMAKADWDQPRGHWIDARSAVYVIGSKRRGSMGPTFVSFADESGARAFAGQYGGKVLAYAQVTPEIADLGGGAATDNKM